MDKKKIEKAFEIILKEITPDFKKKKDLKDTPKRAAQSLEELLSGYRYSPEKELEVFLAQEHDEIILLKDISFFSICEHHLLPFFGKCHIAYIPQNKITGLSKIIRVVEILSKRLQVQERLTTQIADVLMKKLKPKGVMVVIEAEHLCISMRGVKAQDSKIITSCVRGIFRKNQKTRQETLFLLKNRD